MGQVMTFNKTTSRDHSRINDVMVFEIIDEEKSKLGKSIIYDKFLKQKVMQKLRLRVMQQVLLKNFKVKTEQKRLS